MQQRIKSLMTIVMLVFIIVALHYSGYLSYDLYVSKQIEAFRAIGGDTPQYYGHIHPLIVDGFSEEPLAGAIVVIPELNQKYITGDDGYTSLIRIPILEDDRFKTISPKPWGEITLLVYKEGYIEYVLLHTHVWENQTRNGPKVLLFPQDPDNKTEPFSIIEGPHRLWVNDLINKFRP